MRNIEDKNVTSENKNKLIVSLKRGWDTFHRYFVYILIASMIGIYVGISVSKIYYANKIQENVDVGGMVFKGKVYTIVPR